MKGRGAGLRSGGILAALLLIGLALPGGLSPYSQYLGVTILAYAVLAQAWNLVGGYSGQFSLGVSAFVGVGGYATGLFMLHLGMGWLLASLAGTIFSGAFAFVLGFPLLRLRGPYFAVGTLAAAVALESGAQLWTWAGGGNGFVLPINELPSSETLFRLAVVAFVLAMAVILFVEHSAFGLRLMAVRDDDHAAAGVGISGFWHKVAAFSVSGALTGLAGALVAMQTVTVNPSSSFDLNWTTNAALFVVAGGIATTVGPLLGVVVVYVVLTQQLQNLQALSVLIEGGLLVFIVRFAPRGLWPLIRQAFRAAVRRVARRGTAVSTVSTVSTRPTITTPE